jgi:hypothetical protein
MRLVVVLAALAASVVLDVRPSLSAPGRWCANLSAGEGVVRERCGFPSFEACLSEALANGSTSFCVQDPRNRMAEPQARRRSQSQVR